MTLRVGGVKPERVGDGRIDSEAEALNVLGGDERVRRIRMVAVPIDEPDRVEHLHRLVRVEARQHLRDRPQVPIDELVQPAIVVDRAAARPPGNEQLEVRNAERVLDVDREQTTRSESSPPAPGHVPLLRLEPRAHGLRTGLARAGPAGRGRSAREPEARASGDQD